MTKSFVQRFILTITSVLLFSLSGLAQADTTRDIIIKDFEQQRVDGVIISVLKQVTDKQWIPVDPLDEFFAGDNLKVDLQSNFNGYVYFVNLGSSGTRRVLFSKSKKSPFVEAYTSYELPGNNYAISFDANKGVETFLVLISRQRISYLDRAVRNSDGYLRTGESKLLAQLLNDAKSSRPGVGSVGQVAARGVGEPELVTTRDPIWDTSKKSATVTIRPKTTPPNSKKSTGSNRLARNQIAAFSIQLVNKGLRETADPSRRP